MKLGSIDVYTPIIRVRAEIDFHYLPNLSPIEKALVAAVGKFSGDNDNPFAKVPIGELFRSLYGLSGAELIMGEIVDGLIDRGRVHRLIDSAKPTSSLTVSELAVGAGSNGGLSTVTSDIAAKAPLQSLNIQRFYDPLTEEVFTEQPSDIGKRHERYFVPSEPFEKSLDRSWIAPAVRDELEQEISIAGSNLTIEEVCWRKVEAKVLVKDGELSIATPSSSLQSYIAGLTSKTKSLWFTTNGESYQAAGNKNPPEGSSFPVRIPKTVTGLIVTYGLEPECLKDFGVARDVVHICVNPKAEISSDMSLTEQIGNSALRIDLNYDIDIPVGTMSWIDGGLRLVSVELKWQNTDVVLSLAQPSDGYLHNHAFDSILEVLLDEAAVSETPAMSILPCYWLDPERFWAFVLQNIESLVNPEELICYLDTVIRGLENGVGIRVSALKTSLPLDRVKSKLGETFLSVDKERMSELIGMLKRLESWLESDLEIQDLLPAARTFSESQYLRNMFVENNVSFDFPCAVYNQTFLPELLSDFPQLDWLVGLEPANEFERLLQVLSEKHSRLSADRAGGGTHNVYDDSYLERATEDWSKLLSRFEVFYPQAANFISTLQSDDFNQVKDSVPDTSNRDVIAFDTNVIIRDGDLLGSLLESDFLVFPRVVMHEVEKRKTPRNKSNQREVKEAEGFRINGRKALRQIQKLPLDSLQVASGNFELLLPDEVRNGDGEIIACLIPFVERSKSVTFVTADVDLPLKCRAYGISAMDPASFAKQQKEKLERLADELRCG